MIPPRKRSFLKPLSGNIAWAGESLGGPISRLAVGRWAIVYPSGDRNDRPYRAIKLFYYMVGTRTHTRPCSALSIGRSTWTAKDSRPYRGCDSGYRKGRIPARSAIPNCRRQIPEWAGVVLGGHCAGAQAPKSSNPEGIPQRPGVGVRGPIDDPEAASPTRRGCPTSLVFLKIQHGRLKISVWRWGSCI